MQAHILYQHNKICNATLNDYDRPKIKGPIVPINRPSILIGEGQKIRVYIIFNTEAVLLTHLAGIIINLSG